MFLMQRHLRDRLSHTFIVVFILAPYLFVLKMLKYLNYCSCVLIKLFLNCWTLCSLSQSGELPPPSLLVNDENCPFIPLTKEAVRLWKAFFESFAAPVQTLLQASSQCTAAGERTVLPSVPSHQYLSKKTQGCSPSGTSWSAATWRPKKEIKARQS